MTNRIVSVDETFTLPSPVRDKLTADLSASGPGEMLGVTVHNPATQAQYGSLSGTTFAAIAPGALVVTFTAPSSGKVTVDLSAHVHQCTEAGFWALMDGGVVVPGTTVRASGAVGLDAGGVRSATVLVAGLTPGQSYTYTWAAAHLNTTFQIRVGGSATSASTGLSGPATMIVRDAPF